MAGIRLPLRDETGQPLPYFRLVRRSRQSDGCRMGFSDERATPGEGIGRRRIYDFWRMLEVERREWSVAFRRSTIRIRRVHFHLRRSDHHKACCPYKRSEMVDS